VKGQKNNAARLPSRFAYSKRCLEGRRENSWKCKHSNQL